MDSSLKDSPHSRNSSWMIMRSVNYLLVRSICAKDWNLLTWTIMNYTSFLHSGESLLSRLGTILSDWSLLNLPAWTNLSLQCLIGWIISFKQKVSLIRIAIRGLLWSSVSSKVRYWRRWTTRENKIWTTAISIVFSQSS